MSYTRPVVALKTSAGTSMTLTDVEVPPGLGMLTTSAVYASGGASVTTKSAALQLRRSGVSISLTVGYTVCVGSGGTLKKARTKMTSYALRTRLFLPPILCARVFYLWYLHLGRFEKCTSKKARTKDVTSTSYPGFYPRSCVLGYFTWVDLKSIPQVLG